MKFHSVYNGIGYKVPGTKNVARFNGGELETNDEAAIKHLRSHPDFGQTLFEGAKPVASKPTMQVNGRFCPFCKKWFTDDAEFEKHLRAEHGAEAEKKFGPPGPNPATLPQAAKPLPEAPETKK